MAEGRCRPAPISNPPQILLNRTAKRRRRWPRQPQMHQERKKLGLEGLGPGLRPGGTAAVMITVNKSSWWRPWGPRPCQRSDQGRWDSCDDTGVGSAIVDLLRFVPRPSAPETPVTAEIIWQGKQNTDSSRPPVKGFNTYQHVQSS